MQETTTGLTAERTKIFLEQTVAGAIVTVDGANPAGPGSIGVQLAINGREATKAEISSVGDLLKMVSPGVLFVVTALEIAPHGGTWVGWNAPAATDPKGGN